MDFLKGMKDDASDCDFADEFQKCPFLKNINEPTCFSFSSAPIPFAAVSGVKGPIFEDDFSFDLAFKVFHGKDGIVPLSGRSRARKDVPDIETPSPYFNPLAGKAASLSLSSFGFGGPFGFGPFNDKWNKHKKQSKSSNDKSSSSQEGGNSSSKHEALGDEWLKSGNCPIAKSYRAANKVLPLVASALKPPAGMKFKCPAAIVAARAALARTALVKNLRPQPLPAKMLAVAALGMAANVPLGAWREHVEKFSFSWFVAVHAAVPFIAMLRKSVLMPKTAMVLTIAASVVGQVIGSRAERLRMKRASSAGPGLVNGVTVEIGAKTGYDVSQMGGVRCGSEIGGTVFDPIRVGNSATGPGNVCF